MELQIIAIGSDQVNETAGKFFHSGSVVITDLPPSDSPISWSASTAKIHVFVSDGFLPTTGLRVSNFEIVPLTGFAVSIVAIHEFGSGEYGDRGFAGFYRLALDSEWPANWDMVYGLIVRREDTVHNLHYEGRTLVKLPGLGIAAV
ncbi:hypothetical protein K788_0005366 [Paraburkholderia caribensis MBA4]|uniref:Uncharacterized protein n=1 Tax=Paraburkholderia caribensis MBA4 TaxID=1323664 RepID=A0A0P0RG20_9BURK|nr:hypothetical protein [Paraburkholderia caribensis]ALL67473.1 hypothetical protein K788_0005366 [Paraburkholderia caribensis MBA4]